ncbi:MAG: ribosome small subunit-dependent GTPase A [Bacteroidales bacterium]|nr:ribosome small subunit-dependent GTPase A [Bacteroidales bacterium]
MATTNNQGIVIKTTGSSYIVKTTDNCLYPCFIKGNFRIKGIKTTNPIAIGDKVEFMFDKKNEYGLITKIFERKNYIIRKATKLSKQTHIIASNLDEVFLIVCACLPKTSTMFIDRFLVTANAYNVPATIVLNKIDIYQKQDKDYAQELIDIYHKIGYKCISISAKDNIGIESIKQEMKDKVVLFAGNSGVGKSTLINVLCPDAKLKTEEVSQSHLTGKHTTTFAQMIELDDIHIIDTPGIKSFGMVDFKKEELALYFPEMKSLLKDCKYYNCTHTHEPHCAIKQAVEEGIISEERYKNYLKMLDCDDMSE